MPLDLHEGQQSEMEYAPDNFKGTYQTITYIPGLGVSLIRL